MALAGSQRPCPAPAHAPRTRRQVAWRLGLPLLAVGWLTVAVVFAAPSRAEPGQGSPPLLRVAIKPLAPFIVQRQGQFQGFSIDLLDQIARRAGFRYALQPVDSVEQGQADLALAGISITSAREKKVDFSLPMYHSGLQVLVPSSGEQTSPLSAAAPVLGRLVPILIFVALLLAVVAHIIWLVERDNPEHFPRSYREGIVEGLWWASVTMTTVGYGDRTPTGKLGRMLGVIWMFAAIIIIANVTASYSAAFTVQSLQSSITGLNDLAGKRVGTVRGTTSSAFLTDRGIDLFPVETIDHAYALLKGGKVDAVIFDAPVLQYYARTAGAGQVRVVGSVFDPQDYGVALTLGSPYRKAINQALLQVQEDGTYARIQESWFGPPN
ncbi:MAG: hypothetical protein NVSMB32_04100 [Actinomycetota bacterium]